MFDTKNDYQKFADDCMNEAENILYLERQLKSGTVGHDEISEIAKNYEKKGVYIRLRFEEDVLMDNLPDGDDYYYIESGFNDCRLGYMKTMTDMRQRQLNMAWMIVLSDIIMAIVVGVLLYVAMKKIYKPVSDISHELSKPLTGIL